MVREFKYRGYTLEELKKMPMDTLIDLLPSRARRKLSRSNGLTLQERKLYEKIRKITQGKIPKKTIKTHCRGLIILPEFVGLTIHIHNGKEFVPVKIKPQMIGHRLGEFAITNKIVKHGKPGVGATKSSMYVPLK